MIPISSVMTKNVITVREQTPIYDALILFTEHKISGMPVVDDQNRVIGILSEKDVLVILLKKTALDQWTVGHYMSRNITCFTQDASVYEICEFFIKSSFRRVPIVQDGVLVGIVSRRDIIPLILEARSILSQDRYH